MNLRIDQITELALSSRWATKIHLKSTALSLECIIKQRDFLKIRIFDEGKQLEIQALVYLGQNEVTRPVITNFMTQELKNQMNQLQAVQQKVVADQAQLRCTINTMQTVDDKVQPPESQPRVPGSNPPQGSLIIQPSPLSAQSSVPPVHATSGGQGVGLIPSFCQKNHQQQLSNSPVIISEKDRSKGQFFSEI